MTVKPKRNQKVMSDEEKEKLKEGSIAKKEKVEETKRAIEKAENAIIERAKAELPQLLETRIQAIEKALIEELDDYKGLTSACIHQAISRQSPNSVNRLAGYTSRELMIVYEAYTKMVNQINKNTLYVPSISSFCAFAGFSTITFEHNYLQSPDDEKRNAAQMIKDYITNLMLDAGKMRKTDASVTIHESKAILKNVEAQSPQVIQFGGNIDPLKIMEDINRIKKNVVDAEYKEKEK